MAPAMAAVSMLLLLQAALSLEAMVIPLHPGWTASFSSSASRQMSNGNFLPLATSNNATLNSPNSTFALGLFSLQNTLNYRLIICILPYNSSLAVDVWNNGKSFSQNVRHVLMVPADGSALQLVDSDNSVVWSINGDVSGLELAETGNLLVYNSSNGTLWQSFDHPTDSFLPGQTLKQGMQLTASNSSASGSCSLVLEPSGVVLYSTAGYPKLPYYALTVNRTSDYSKALQACGTSNLSMTIEYNISNTGQNTVNFSGGCSTDYSDLTVTLYGYIGQHDPRFIRLESDGNLIFYLWKGKAEGFVKEYSAFTSKDCNLPNPCGSYGVCSSSGCSCPVASSSSSVSGQFFSNSTSGGCTSNTEVTCDASSMKNHRLLAMSDVTYFSNKFVTPLNLSHEACQSSCLSNCSCMAAFYEMNSTTQGCFHIFEKVLSLKQVSSDSRKTYYAYLKVQLSPNKRQNTKLIIILSVVLGSSFLVLSVFLGLFLKYYFRKPLEDDFLNAIPGLPHRFSLKELEIATNRFYHILGEGGFGTVFGGKLEDGRSVAVKRLESARQGLKEFETEVKTLGGISHVNLVKLYGFCLEGNNRLLVYEWISKGSLDKWLFSKDPSKIMSWRDRIGIATDAAEGLAYLHEGRSDPVLHLDIKPQNILLDENFKAKVSDFGMAKLINTEASSVMTQVRGTPGYLAPEWPRHCMVTKKCDVYSYGIVLLEIVSGQKVIRPVQTMIVADFDESAWYLPSWAIAKVRSGDMVGIVDPKMKGNFDVGEAENLIKLACSCIQENPNLRPSMSEIVQILQAKLKVPDLIPGEVKYQPFSKITNTSSGRIVGDDSLNSMLVAR